MLCPKEQNIESKGVVKYGNPCGVSENIIGQIIGQTRACLGGLLVDVSSRTKARKLGSKESELFKCSHSAVSAACKLRGRQLF